MTTHDDSDELPEFTEEMLEELKQKPVDLHLGPAEAKPHNDWFVKKYGPNPPGPGILALDILIMGLFFIFMDIFVLSWMYVFN